jgi:plastocyanin
MPVPGRSILLAAALAGAALGAGPAVGAKHRKARLVATKARAHGHVPARAARRPPLVGTLPVTTEPGTTTPATTDPVPTTPAPSCPTALGVSEGEYYTQPSRTTLCAGSVLVELRNAGEDDHDLKVLDVDNGTVVATWAITHPGDAVQKHLTLAAGTYRLFCTLSDGNGAHDELGMHAVITVG